MEAWICGIVAGERTERSDVQSIWGLGGEGSVVVEVPLLAVRITAILNICFIDVTDGIKDQGDSIFFFKQSAF